jgi:quinol monooxygenase YgiN
MTFIQLIEISTSRVDEIEALVDQWISQTQGQRLARRGTTTEDRDRPGVYVQMVEFPSYEEAMANSQLPATAEMAQKLAALCDSPPVFRNLDVRRVVEL